MTHIPRYIATTRPYLMQHIFVLSHYAINDKVVRGRHFWHESHTNTHTSVHVECELWCSAIVPAQCTTRVRLGLFRCSMCRYMEIYVVVWNLITAHIHEFLCTIQSTQLWTILEYITHFTFYLTAHKPVRMWKSWRKKHSPVTRTFSTRFWNDFHIKWKPYSVD